MFIWTNKPRLFAGLLALALASCVEPGAQSVVRVGGVALAAPSGYCVAPQSRMQLAASEFVAFARCNQAQGKGGAVLTATLGAEGSAAGIDMAGPDLPAFVISPEGRRALSQSGLANAVWCMKCCGLTGRY
ncbi:MAG: hypothetical protein U1D06_04640 [Paracoccaceae bacterium]|nr:hypothetical protein [Paracoccaceae bacterium]